MDQCRLNSQVFRWTHDNKDRARNWCYKLDCKLYRNNCVPLTINQYYGPSERRTLIESLNTNLSSDIASSWFTRINSDIGTSKKGGNKLRQYKLFKDEYTTESYVQNIAIPRSHRSALAKFRCGVAPIKIETGRYQGLPLHERTCFHCSSKIENEIHVILICPLYAHLRTELISHAQLINTAFSSFSFSEQFAFLMSDTDIAKLCAKTCNAILIERRNILYKN